MVNLLMCEPMPKIYVGSLSISTAIKLEWAAIKCKLGSITCRQWWRKVATSGGANDMKVLVL